MGLGELRTRAVGEAHELFNAEYEGHSLPGANCLFKVMNGVMLGLP